MKGRHHGRTAERIRRGLPHLALAGLLALGACSDPTTSGGQDAGGFATTDSAAAADGSVPVLDGSAPPLTGDITYYGHARAILEARCVPCHSPGQHAPIHLTTYETAYASREAIRYEVGAGRMPPWRAASTCDLYAPHEGLTEEEMVTLLTWVDLGAPEGFPADYIPPFVDPPTALQNASVAVAMPQPYTPPAGGDDYRCFPVTWPGDVPLYVTGANIVPGALAQVQHVIAYVSGPEMATTLLAADMAHDGPGYPCFGSPMPSEGASVVTNASAFSWLSAWLPGDDAHLFPEGTGVEVPPGSTIILQVHYDTEMVAPVEDLTTAYFEVASSVSLPAAIYPFTDFSWAFSPGAMTIPAGEAEVSHSYAADITGWANNFSVELGRAANAPMLVHSVALQMNRIGSRATVSLERSNGAEDCMLDLGSWDFDWRRSYTFADAKIVNPGDMVHISCTWDNSQANQPWVDGAQLTAQDVAWGEGPSDEMCLAYLFVTATTASSGGCVPNCTGKTCGADGCGGNCGLCPPEAPTCDPVTHQCTDQCIPSCGLKECGDDGCGGSCGECPVTAPNCNPATHQCTSMCIPECGDVQCGSDGCGGSCGTCPNNAPYCIQGICYADAAGTCLPACDGKDCGADGCGGTCGVCPPHAPTCTAGVCGGICQANCSGKQCGDDGCGGSCGECPDWAPSCVNNFCVDDCAPDCIGKQCGDDGCGGVCGFCGADAACVFGECKLGCANPCEGKQCGDNGCGGSCGVCGGNFVCQNNICVDQSGCTPSCFGKQCGDDGCGGSCGSCANNLWCQNGVCVGNGCTPNCVGIQCGPDGCGGSCGTCAGNTWCQQGVCTGGGCTPNCVNKECGNDGCGGSCGNCPGGTTCNASGVCQNSGGTGQGACTNAADQAVLAQIDAQTMATECGLGCIGDLNPSACATSCLQGQSDLSQGCAGCFGKLVGCIIDNCLTDCISPESVECTTCTQNQCGPSFEACSGLQLQ